MNQTNEAVAYMATNGELVKDCHINSMRARGEELTPLMICEPNTITITESEYAKLKATIDDQKILINELLMYLECINGTEQTKFTPKFKVKTMAEYARGGLALALPSEKG